MENNPFSMAGVQQWGTRLGFGLPPQSGIRDSLQWFLMARMAALYSLLLVTVVGQVVQAASYRTTLTLGYGVLTFGFASNLLQGFFLGRRSPTWIWVTSALLLDIFLVSLWIFFSGNEPGLSALLYLVHILLSSVAFSKRGAWISSLGASIFLGIVCSIHPGEETVFLWSIYAALFLILGLVGGYLSEALVLANQNLQVESRKRETLERIHEEILGSVPTGVLQVDGEMRVRFLNKAGEHILGSTLAQMQGKTLQEVGAVLLPFFTALDAEDLSDDALEDSETTLSRTKSESHQSFFAHPKSKESTRLQQTVEVGDAKNKRVLRGDVAEFEKDPGERVLIFQDVTKLSHLEEKLKQHEKMAAIGQLAAGIAHEIRNPLASMSGSIQLLRTSLDGFPKQEENRKLMDIAIREIDRLNELISEFLDFVRPIKMKSEPVNLEQLLAEIVLSTSRSSTPFEVRLETKLEPNTIALGNAQKLKQVGLNLIVNSIQSMEKAGRVEVGCRILDALHVVFWVEDSGCGMSEEVMSHLFEPFFTTKEKGTGLGLATAYKIIEGLSGEIRVRSKVKEGTRIEVVLPSAKA